MSTLIPMFVSATGLREYDVRLIIANAPARYKTYPIEKRRGGQRWISQPARELKALQRVFLSEILMKLPVHPAATAYRPGLSIRDNASAHASNGPILKMDFKDFFPSLNVRDWQTYCRRHELFLDAEDMRVSSNILFHRMKGSTTLKLAIGAPTSPHLSNLLLFEFDERMTRAIADRKIVYTRYADDITFSAPRTGYLQGVEKLVGQITREIETPSLRINRDKTVVATKKYKRMITGLILSNEASVTVGRRRKRELRQQMHYAQTGRLDDQELAKLSGWLAFVKDVEPLAFAKVRERYGEALLNRIKASAGRKDPL